MIQILLIALLSLLAQLVLPWWSLAIIAFCVCYWRSTTGLKAFGYGFVGVSLVWLAYALVIHQRTDGIFTSRMGELLFKTDWAGAPLLVTTLVGGLTGGLAGLSGHLIRHVTGNQPINHTP